MAYIGCRADVPGGSRQPLLPETDTMSFTFETLENRVLLAASVAKRGSTLVITGDTGNNMIGVAGTTDAGSFDVNIDGNTDTYHGISNLKIDGKNGQDTITLMGAQFVGKVDIKGGNDVDIITIDSFSAAAKALSIKSGNGDDIVTVDGSFGDVKIDLGNGDNLFLSADLTSGKNFNLKAGSGNDDIQINFLSAPGKVSLSLGNGDNKVVASGAVSGKDFSVKTGNGEDSVMVVDLRMFGTAKIDLGKGDDTADITGTAFKSIDVKMGDGNDTLKLDVMSNRVTIDGGKGLDTYNGPTFPTRIKGFELP